MVRPHSDRVHVEAIPEDAEYIGFPAFKFVFSFDPALGKLREGNDDQTVPGSDEAKLVKRLRELEAGLPTAHAPPSVRKVLFVRAHSRHTPHFSKGAHGHLCGLLRLLERKQQVLPPLARPCGGRNHRGGMRPLVLSRCAGFRDVAGTGAVQDLCGELLS